MAFPETQASLIVRLAAGGSERDWQQFLNDYWAPLVRFAIRSGRLPLDQAEDIAAETMTVLVRSQLLSRWHDRPAGKLRGLLCGVVRNLLSNKQRIAWGRRRLIQKVAEAGGVPDVLVTCESAEPTMSDSDTFYHVWVDELLANTMKRVLRELHAEGRGDYFRALYGRICEDLSAAQIAAALRVQPADVENFIRVAKGRLSRCLEAEVRRHVDRYSSAGEQEADYQREWDRLHTHLARSGGLDGAIRLEASQMDRLPSASRRSASFLAACAELTAAKKT